MGAGNYTDLKRHIGHRIVCVGYGDDKETVNVAIECEDCSEVLFDYDNDIVDTTTTPEYWDCECETDYIHPKSKTYCPICQTTSDEQPDSRVTEVKEYLEQIIEDKEDSK